MKRKEAERELEKHNRNTRRFEIIANSISMQEVFFSEDEACRKLNIDERKLDECIEKRIPVNWQGDEHLLQKQEASRTDIRDFNTKNNFFDRMDTMEWEKKTNETGKAYMWFCRYRDMGWERSIAKVVQKHGGNSATLFRWSSKYDWVSRAEAYDDYLDEKKREAQEDEILEASRRHAELAQKFIDLVLKRLHTLDPDEISTRDLALFAEMAVKIERDALGMAKKFEVTQNIQQDDKLADDLIKRSKELLERD